MSFPPAPSLDQLPQPAQELRAQLVHPEPEPDKLPDAPLLIMPKTEKRRRTSRLAHLGHATSARSRSRKINSSNLLSHLLQANSIIGITF
jgi:hypothetical protein